MESTSKECERACRIAMLTNEQHERIANIYENLVDRDFAKVEADAHYCITELKLILKAIKDDDF
jgi:hypothetical protein